MSTHITCRQGCVGPAHLRAATLVAASREGSASPRSASRSLFHLLTLARSESPLGACRDCQQFPVYQRCQVPVYQRCQAGRSRCRNLLHSGALAGRWLACRQNRCLCMTHVLRTLARYLYLTSTNWHARAIARSGHCAGHSRLLDPLVASLAAGRARRTCRSAH